MDESSEPVGHRAGAAPEDDPSTGRSASRTHGVDVVGRHGKLVRRTALISGLTLVSRIIGFARESLAAALFGDRSAINDAFVTAWRVPNMFRSLMGEGAIATAMQSALTRTDHERGEEAGRRLFHAIARTVFWASIVLCGVGVLIVTALPDHMPGTGWAWLGEDPAPVRELTARMLPFVVFVCLAAVAGGALQVRGHFLAPAAAPAIMNVCWIASLFAVAYAWGWHAPAGATDAQQYDRQFGMARALALLVLGAGAVLFLVHVPALSGVGLLRRARRAAENDDGRASAPHLGKDTSPSNRVSTREVWTILRDTLPLAFGAAVYQLNVLVSGFLAEALLPDGGPSALYYASRLQQLPLSLVSVAATSAVFPMMTALGQTGDRARLRKLHDDTHHAIAFVALPATLGLLVLAGPVCAVCFQHGAFGPEGVERTAAALRWLTLAILPAGAAGLVARAYYSVGDFATPVKVAAGMLVLNTTLNVLFIRVGAMDADGLGLATAICAWGNVALLLPGLRRRLGPSSSEEKHVSRLFRVAAVSGLAAAAGWGTYRGLAGGTTSAWVLSISILVSVAVYAAGAAGLGLPEWRAAVSRLRER